MLAAPIRPVATGTCSSTIASRAARRCTRSCRCPPSSRAGADPGRRELGGPHTASSSLDDLLDALVEGEGHSRPPIAPTSPPARRVAARLREEQQRRVAAATSCSRWRRPRTTQEPFSVSSGAPATAIVAADDRLRRARDEQARRECAEPAAAANRCGGALRRVRGAERAELDEPRGVARAAEPVTPDGSLTSQLQASLPWLPAAPSPTTVTSPGSGGASLRVEREDVLAVGERLRRVAVGWSGRRGACRVGVRTRPRSRSSSASLATCCHALERLSTT